MDPLEASGQERRNGGRMAGRPRTPKNKFFLWGARETGSPNNASLFGVDPRILPGASPDPAGPAGPVSGQGRSLLNFLLFSELG